jgi:RNase P/RNase MRP subunit POP5
MKPLKPSHREHKRYFLLSGEDANKESIEGAIIKFIGILGYAKASPEIIKSTKDKYKNKIILSVNRKELDKVKSSFLLSGKEIKIERVSGILNRL